MIAACNNLSTISQFHSHIPANKLSSAHRKELDATFLQMIRAQRDYFGWQMWVDMYVLRDTFYCGQFSTHLIWIIARSDKHQEVQGSDFEKLSLYVFYSSKFAKILISFYLSKIQPTQVECESFEKSGERNPRWRCKTEISWEMHHWCRRRVNSTDLFPVKQSNILLRAFCLCGHPVF